MKDQLKIFVHAYEVMLRVGLYDAEKEKPQPVTLSVEVETSALPDYSKAHLSDLVDYELIYSFITQKLPLEPHTELLETVAEKIIDFCFDNAHVHKISVSLQKTALFDKAVAGVKLERFRKH